MAVNPSSAGCELDLLVKLSRDDDENGVECATGKSRGKSWNLPDISEKG